MTFFKQKLPIGNSTDRASLRIWPMGWKMTNPYLRDYSLDNGTKMGCHTGVDLVRNDGTRTLGQPVFSIGPGKVQFKGIISGSSTWGNVVVIYHGIVDNKPLFSRYAHLLNINKDLKKNDEVNSDIQIGTIGSGPPNSGMKPHLHFDISTTMDLFGDQNEAGNWPRLKNLVERIYVNPEDWLPKQHIFNKDANGKPIADADTPKVMDITSATTDELWLVTEATLIRQQLNLGSPAADIDPGFSFLLQSNTQEQSLDGSIWVQISTNDKDCAGNWVKKKDNNRIYIAKQT